MSDNFYITTAISYVNGKPHLGHAYEAILTDAVARFQRLDGRNVMFLTGTDEHGEKVAKTAAQNQLGPKEFADQNAQHFLDMTRKLDISNDDFIRTTEPRHYKAAQALWQRLQDKGDIYLGQYAGWYSIREEGYFAEDELTKDSATGKMITPNGTEAEWVEEESYFFKLSAYTDKLLAHYEKHPEFIQPEARRNEILSFVRGGLKDLSVSRQKNRLPWGVAVPGDDNHVMYVWLDALTNYMTAIDYPDTQSDLYKKFWPADIHVIGKDIIRFHTVYWPAFLISADLPLPKSVFAHGFINVQGQKMSKSIGNVLSPDGLVETYGLDQIRYFLLREIPHGQDGNFSHEQAVQRINADLANGLGNLAQRSLSMIYKNCEQRVPQPGPYDEADKALLVKAYNLISEKTHQDMASFKLHNILEDIWAVVRAADQYVDEQAPWALKKESPERMKTVLYILAETIRCLAIAVQPFMPGSAAKLLDQIQVKNDRRFFKNIDEDDALKPGTELEKPEGVFPRLEDERAKQKSA